MSMPRNLLWVQSQVQGKCRRLILQHVHGSHLSWSRHAAHTHSSAKHTVATEQKVIVGQSRASNKKRWDILKLEAVTGEIIISRNEIECDTDHRFTTQKVDNHSNNTFPTTTPIQHHFTIDAVKSLATTTFLPKGYPHTVGDGFLQYCRWQFGGMIAGTVTGVLSMQALLFAIGLGAGAVPLAAAVNWILKDGMGQLGGVVYAALIGGRFDEDPKRHRYLSTIALQASTMLEVITPLVPFLFLPLASISNVGKNIACLAGSATKAQMHLSFCRQNNLGDITAKITSQAIAANLVGTALGIAVSQITGEDSMNVLAAFIPLSLFVVFANYKSSTMVAIPTLNLQRGEILFSDLLHQSGFASQHISSNNNTNKNNTTNNKNNTTTTTTNTDFKNTNNNNNNTSTTNNTITTPTRNNINDNNNTTIDVQLVPMTPKLVSESEVFVQKYSSCSLFTTPLLLNANLGDLVESSQLTSKEIKIILNREALAHEESYFITILESNGVKSVALWFDNKAKEMDVMTGLYHACALRVLVAANETIDGEGDNNINNTITNNNNTTNNDGKNGSNGNTTTTTTNNNNNNNTNNNTTNNNNNNNNTNKNNNAMIRASHAHVRSNLPHVAEQMLGQGWILSSFFFESGSTIVFKHT